MAIQTATAEQVCDCVMALKRHIDRVEAELQRRDEKIALLRRALEPFATLNESIEKHQRVPTDWAPWLGDLIHAAAALEMTNE